MIVTIVRAVVQDIDAIKYCLGQLPAPLPMLEETEDATDVSI